MKLPALTDSEWEEILSDPLVSEYLKLQDGFWYKFQPRPDNPAQFDQQQSFVEGRDAVAFLIGGNAAGTTEASAFKAAQFVLRDQPPPRHDTPFWIISETYEQTCDTCWKEKLLGNGHIPEGEVEWERVRWLDSALGWPLAVPLKPWKDRPGKNWMLEFKSYKQGRKTMQARSIGGFWFSEQFPWSLFLEVLRGCRNYMYPGAQFCEFTPIEPDLCLQIEQVMENPPGGWKFYTANTEMNKSNLANGWYENFFATVSDEMRATRQIGALATFQGLIYPQFSLPMHVVGDDVIDPMLPSTWHRRGLDWGASEEHPFTAVWGYRDGAGDWFIYDEYWDVDQSKITMDHAKAIRERWVWPEGSPYHGMTYADPSRPGEINEFNFRGIPTQQAANNIFKGIECVRELLQPSPTTGKPRLFIHERCKHLIQEFRKYRWVKSRRPVEGVLLNPKAPRPEPLKRDDDTIDALRYLLFSDHQGRGATVDSMAQNSKGRPGERSADIIRKQIRNAMKR